MARLIVNADDLGLDESVNDGILLAHQRGIVTSASLLPAGPAFEHALGLCRGCPTLDLGVHLTLVDERPASNGAEIPSLVDQRGRLCDRAALLRRYAAGRISADQIERELRAQIARVVETGLHVSHLDSHQHLHMLPMVFSIVEELAHMFGIGALRLPGERVRSHMFHSITRAPRVLKLEALRALSLAARQRLSLAAPDHFFGFYAGGRLEQRALAAVLRALPPRGVSELMCHPGLRQLGGRYASWGYRWPVELAALTDERTRRVVEEEGIDLVDFASLSSAAAGTRD